MWLGVAIESEGESPIVSEIDLCITPQLHHSVHIPKANLISKILVASRDNDRGHISAYRKRLRFEAKKLGVLS